MLANEDKLSAASSYQPGALHLAQGPRNDLANGADRGCESLGASLDDQFVAAPLSQVEQMTGEARPEGEQQAARERVLGGQELGEEIPRQRMPEGRVVVELRSDGGRIEGTTTVSWITSVVSQASSDSGRSSPSTPRSPTDLRRSHSGP